jgi:hypothetical protein
MVACSAPNSFEERAPVSGEVNKHPEFTPPGIMRHKGRYRIVRRVSIMSLPVQQAESLGQRDRVNRYTGGRKAAREEATGSSEKRREAGANQATAPRDPRGKARAELLEAQS